MRRIILILCAWLSLTGSAHAFSLLGPYTDWMDTAKGYRIGDIGGPMTLGEEYRWNIPVVTYGFERSFVDYFGSNGVAAVERAIQILNQVPAASQVNLATYPRNGWSANAEAGSLGLTDMKSMILSMLLQQMGLTSPEQYAFCVRDFFYFGTTPDFLVIQRNFDPVTQQPSSWVNDTLFSYQIINLVSPAPNGVVCDAVEFAVDPTTVFNSSIAGLEIYSGDVAVNLSQDDVGGLRYLLSGSHVRFENLLPDIQPATGTFIVRGAYRPGIEKVTFVRHPTGTLDGAFKPFTNQWNDLYYSGDLPVYQPVKRVTTYPDIVFRAGDTGFALFTQTDTSGWSNNAALNGNPGAAGPGVIRPPIAITLNNNGSILLNYGPFNLDQLTSYRLGTWASFDDSTNAIVTYPANLVLFQPSVVRFKLVTSGRTNEFAWPAKGFPFARFNFQTSTNLTSWSTLTTFTNSGTNFSYTFQASPNESRRYFRAISQ